MKTALVAFGLFATLSTSACLQSEDVDPMMKQDKYRAYAPNPFFADGRGMRTPPPNTVSRERERTGSAQVQTGMDDKGAPLTAIPVEVNAHLMAVGHKQFDIHCAICHGASGDGHSLVSTQMSLKTPPDLNDKQKRELADGTIFNAITNGYGLMNGYSADLTTEERWAVVAYLRALQRSQNAQLSDAPADEAARLQKEAQQ